MQDTPEFRACLCEVRVYVESAIALIDMVSQHEIVQSNGFNQMAIFLYSEADTLDKMKALEMGERHPEALPQNRGIGRAPLRVVRG